jgi:hypothetical protein
MNRANATLPARRAALLTAAAALAAAASACASRSETERPLPEWFVAQQAALEKEGYPRLENVPDRVDATVDQGHWDGVTRELDRAAAEMMADPRSEPVASAPEQEAEALRFSDAAIEELAATRGPEPALPAATVAPTIAPAPATDAPAAAPE